MPGNRRCSGWSASCALLCAFACTHCGGEPAPGDLHTVTGSRPDRDAGVSPPRPTCQPETCVDPGDEICGDNYDENCNPCDDVCPTSQSTKIQVPEWDCVNGPPPPHVYAHALFSTTNDYYQPNACFVFYEGLPGEYYVSPVNLEPTPERALQGPFMMCEAVEGCICPSVENWSYDRGRLYALTLEGDPENCEAIVVHDQAGDEQVVSNDCRKYLYQIHFNRSGLSFLTHDFAALERRLHRFDTVEIACFEGQPFDDLPFASLLVTPIVFNQEFSGL